MARTYTGAVTEEGGQSTSRPLPKPGTPAPGGIDWCGYRDALGAVAAATAIAWAISQISELSNVVMLYLLAIVAVATRHGRGPSAVASIVSVAAFDVFFVPPYLTFAVSNARYALTFVVMLVVGLMIGNLTARVRAQAEALRRREQRTAALYAMSRELASVRGVADLAAVVVRHVCEVFRTAVVLVVPDPHGQLAVRASAGGLRMDAAEIAVAGWVFEHQQPAGSGTSMLPGARALYVPLVAASRVVGVLGVRPVDARELEAPDQRRHLEAFTNQAALAIDRSRLADEAQAAELRVQTERLRSSLLSSVSHDLRTPLASITGAVSTVLDNDARLSPEKRRELLESAHGEAERLNRLVRNLLEITRLESGAMTPRREEHSLEEVVGSALTHLRARTEGRPLEVHLPPDLPLIEIDGILVEQVLINLVDNAATYTPPGSPIRVLVTATDRSLTVEVADRGPGLPPGKEGKVFEKFYRGTPAISPGAGLGLAICKAIVEAHGGGILARNLPEGGLAVRFTLPLSVSPPVDA